MKITFKTNPQSSSKKETEFLLTVLLLIMSLLLMVSANSCKKPHDEITLTINESSLNKAPILLHFMNANSSSTNQPGDFEVKITGRDAALVQLDGGSTTDFETSHGMLPLSLTANASPSASSPVTFNVSANVPGFAPIVQTVTITKDTMTVVSVGMIEYAKPPAGTGVLVTTSPLTGGVSEGATLNVHPGEGMVESAQIKIQPGTQMLDIDGTPISADQLKSHVVNYSAVSTTSYGAFPGGFHPTNVVNREGNQINGGNPINFVSAGLLSINMSAAGTQVRRFSKPVQVSMRLDPNTTNFVTGTNIKAGDKVPLWSLNEDTGQWTAEEEVTIVKDSNGSLTANFETSHLCCFNLDWSWAIAGRPYGTCFKPLTVRIHCGVGHSGIYDVTIVTPNNQYLAGAHGTYVTNGAVVVFPSVPDIAQCKVVISSFNLYLNPRLPILAQTGLFNPCSQGVTDLTFGPPATPSLINVTLNMFGSCNNKKISLLPSGWFYLYNAGADALGQNAWTYCYVNKGVIQYAFGTGVSGSNGRYSIALFNGNSYYMYAYNSHVWYQSSMFTMAARDFTFPAIKGIDGTAIYDKSSNTLNINAKFSMKCR